MPWLFHIILQCVCETLQKIYDAIDQIRKSSTLLLNPLYINISSYFLLCRITKNSVAAADFNTELQDHLTHFHIETTHIDRVAVTVMHVETATRVH